jgi:hypothetical protein
LRKLRWARQHACAEVIMMYDQGNLSLYETLKLAHLSARQQRASLARQQQEIESARIAAQTIEQILDSEDNSGPIRLGAIAAAIRAAVLARGRA